MRLEHMNTLSVRPTIVASNNSVRDNENDVVTARVPICVMKKKYVKKEIL